MTQHPPRPSPPKPKPDNTRWTGEKATVFLKLLARSGKVAASARAVGMSRQAAYRLRARAPKFAEYWDMSMEVWRKSRASSRRRKYVHPLLDKRPVAHGAEGDGSGPAR